MTNKKIINVYNTVYDIVLVVANSKVTLKDLQKKYTYADGAELDEAIKDAIATTCSIRDRQTGRYGILVVYNKDSSVKGVNKTLDRINSAAHEAVHVAMRIYSYIEEDIDPVRSNEHLSYLIGWATQCIYDTWTKK